MLNEQIKILIEELNSQGFNSGNILMFLLKEKENLPIEVNLSDEEHMFLVQNNIVTKNYITNKFQVMIPFYENEDGVVFESNINGVRQFLSKNIDSYRELFIGVRVGSVANKRVCIDNMTKFMLYNPSITFDKILESTRYYINNTDSDYIMNADNFIYNKGSETSKLLTIIEELELGGFKKSNLL